MKPGIYPGISDLQYHGGEGISKSGLDLIRKSPALYKRRYLDGIKDPESFVFKIGKAVHCALLEPERFADAYPDPVSLNQLDVVERVHWPFRNPDKVLFTPDDYLKVKTIAEAIRKNEDSRCLFRDGEAETGIYWNDEKTGALCKIKPDYLIRSQRTILDLKTTRSIDQFVGHSIRTYRYDVQAALYLRGCSIVFREPFEEFIFVVVEKDPPHRVLVYRTALAEIESGKAQLDQDIARFAECKAKDQWPEE